MEECLTVDQVVVGSNPITPAVVKRTKRTKKGTIVGKQPSTKAREWCHKHARVTGVAVTGMVTQVEVEVRLGNLTLRGNGLTRNGPSDEYSAVRGVRIARGRASKAIAAQLVRTEMRPWDFA